MAGIYIDLLPSPQFDRSLVAYCIGNFNKIKNVMGRVQGRIWGYNNWMQGPWSKGLTFHVALRCDLTIWCEATAYTNTVGWHGFIFYFDGPEMSIWANQYWNEANSHKKLSAMNIARDVLPGNHTFTVGTAHDPQLLSDGGDRARIAIMFYERL